MGWKFMMEHMQHRHILRLGDVRLEYLVFLDDKSNINASMAIYDQSINPDSLFQVKKENGQYFVVREHNASNFLGYASQFASIIPRGSLVDHRTKKSILTLQELDKPSDPELLKNTLDKLLQVTSANFKKPQTENISDAAQTESRVYH